MSDDARQPGYDVFRLDGRTAVVTGGNQGLGLAFAHALARSGAKVVIVARSGERTAAVVEDAAAQGIELLGVQADLTDDAQVARAVAECAALLGGRVDVLVNNAGACVHAPAFEVADDDFDAVMNLNVRALWKTTLAVGALMRENGGGSIVNVGSISG